MFLTTSFIPLGTFRGNWIQDGFERAFATLFGQDVQTFTGTMILNLDQLQQQLDQGESFKIGSIAALCVLNKQLQVFINLKFTMDYDYESQMTLKCFVDHTGCGKLEGGLNSFTSF
jgi:hypothetical protein